MNREVDRNDKSWPYLAPGDLRGHELPSQAALGFHRGRTEELLNRAADTIERLSREVVELQRAREADALTHERLEVSLEEESKRAELLVGEAMVDAHKAAQALKAEAEADAEATRAEAKALIELARQEAERLVAEARLEAKELVADATAESERLAVQAEQYKLLAADVQRRSVGVLKQALETLGEGARTDVSGEEVAPFRTADQQGETQQISEAAGE
jgi:cell division septum initiation protein DivIVA